MYFTKKKTLCRHSNNINIHTSKKKKKKRNEREERDRERQREWRKSTYLKSGGLEGHSGTYLSKG